MERKRAQLSDPARVRRAYLKYCQHQFPNYSDDFNVMPHFITYARLHSLNTNFKIITHLVGQYLDTRGFAKAGREIETASSLEGLAEAARNIDLTEEIIKREKEYTARIKSASLEEKRQLSFYLKEFKEQRKFLQQTGVDPDTEKHTDGNPPRLRHVLAECGQGLAKRGKLFQNGAGRRLCDSVTGQRRKVSMARFRKTPVDSSRYVGLKPS